MQRYLSLLVLGLALGLTACGEEETQAKKEDAPAKQESSAPKSDTAATVKQKPATEEKKTAVSQPEKTDQKTPDNPSSAERAGQKDFDATGKIPCAEEAGQPMGQCDFGVAREGNGSATVLITRADGRPRAIFFDKGVAISADTSQADGYGEFKATKQSDLHMIQVGKERYEIPDAVIFGG